MSPSFCLLQLCGKSGLVEEECFLRAGVKQLFMIIIERYQSKAAVISAPVRSVTERAAVWKNKGNQKVIYNQALTMRGRS